MRSPAIASAPAVGSAGSIVRTTPFERITRGTLDGGAGEADGTPRYDRRVLSEVRLSFDHPLALLSLLVLLALVAAYVLARRRRARFAVDFTNLEVLRAVAPRPSPWRERATGLAAFGTLALLVVGVASPHVERVAPVENATVVLVLDTSRSMLATDVDPTRLGAAKAAARTFLGRVEKRIRVGLVTFSGDVTVAASPTHDRDVLRRSVATIDPFLGGRGTAIGDALARAVELSRQSFAEPGTAPSRSGPIPGAEGAVSILFLSDGRQNQGLLMPDAGAALAAAAKIPVYTVALGTDNPDGPGADPFGGFNRAPDRATLRAIAKTTGGEYFAARSARALSSAYEDLGSRLGREKRRTNVTFVFVAAAALLLVAAVGLSRVWEPSLP
jgi:Ca-activated chloride channel family protein